ncbi:DUF2442 domain-containing protein [Candidatus Electronema sp. PJ]|uniref:DUF2442 domain-containing protein n=1 Tax=Candidatus Electronema sp. PJ TaxID=3401572 RepID=UPI003AA80F1E
MELLLDVVSVMPQKDCTLLLTFENNERRIFDMAPYLERKPYLMLKNVPLFMKASVENGTVVWPGNIDIAPETLWDCSRAIREGFEG